MAIEIVDFPINSMVIFHSYVSLPEGNNKKDHKKAIVKGKQMIPSGNLTVWYWKGPIKIVDLPLKNGDFPVRYVNVYQAG